MYLSFDEAFAGLLTPPSHDGSHPLPCRLHGSVLLLGSFDGFHRGHRALLRAGRDLARRQGVPLSLLQLDPHPRVLFSGAAAFRLVTGAARRLVLNRCGFDFLYTPRFTAAYAGQSAESFCTAILSDLLRVSAVVVGEDFRFGHARRGDVALLRDMGARLGFAVTAVPPVAGDEGRISSTAIRRSIAAGDLATADHLLGTPWITGVERQAGGWRFDPEQILPPPGQWQAALLDEAGSPLGTAPVLLTADRGLRMAAPAGTAMIRFLAQGV